eukprot:UN07186
MTTNSTQGNYTYLMPFVQNEQTFQGQYYAFDSGWTMKT